MYRTTAMCLIMVVGFHLQAQTIAISGKVTDQSGKAVSGALVALKSKDLTATTDASGAYSLSGVISAANNIRILPGGEAISLMKGIVAVRLAKPAQVRIELFDMRGNLLERVLEKPATAGDYRFDVMKHPFAANMMVIRVSIGQRTTSFRFLPFANGMGAFTPSAISSTPGKRLAKMQAAVDELEVSAAGYTTKKVPITSYEGTVDITLETANCTANPSKSTGSSVSGSGPHKVVVETNSDPGIKCGTIYRPEDIGPGKKYPILVWGEGGCSQDGYSNKVAMGEIASYGYFIMADGTPGGTGSCQGGQDGKAFLDYITWSVAQNKNPCSAYYQSLDTTEIASDGFSCGGLMAINTAGDPRFSAVGYTSSGLFSANQTLWKKIHTPFKIMNGGSSDMAYENGLRDYDGISALGIPILYFEKTSAGHGGDLFQAKGDFNIVNLAWLNWQLKGDEGATGKSLLIGPDCKYCKASGWVFKSANIE
jgi:hypothetical protein